MALYGSGWTDDPETTVYALDSTTIDLCLSVFPWAHSTGRGNGSGPFKRSIDFTAYGPVIGVGFRF